MDSSRTINPQNGNTKDGKATRALNAMILNQHRIFIHGLEDASLHEYQQDAQLTALTQDLLCFEEIISHDTSVATLFSQLEHIKNVSPQSFMPLLAADHNKNLEGGPITAQQGWYKDRQRDSYCHRYDVQKHDDLAWIAFDVLEEAKEVQSADEEIWNYSIKTMIRRVLNISHNAANNKSGTYEHALREITCNGEHVWKAARELLVNENAESVSSHLSAPKPDIYLAFPILEECQRQHHVSRRCRSLFLGKFLDFGSERLRALELSGLVSSPEHSLTASRPESFIEELSAQNSTSFEPVSRMVEDTAHNSHGARQARTAQKRDLVCFPWAIVEIKHAFHDDQHVRLQAANGAACALAMLANLARHGGKCRYWMEVPPVLALTFAGPIVHLYVAKSLYCIWKGSLRYLWDTVKLCNVIDRAYIYAVTKLRSWIAAQLDLWESNNMGFRNTDDARSSLQNVQDVLSEALACNQWLRSDENMNGSPNNPQAPSGPCQDQDHRELASVRNHLRSETAGPLATAVLQISSLLDGCWPLHQDQEPPHSASIGTPLSPEREVNALRERCRRLEREVRAFRQARDSFDTGSDPLYLDGSPRNRR